MSLRAGVQLENPDFLSRKLQILIEYYNGTSPNGQFYASGSLSTSGSASISSMIRSWLRADSQGFGKCWTDAQ